MHCPETLLVFSDTRGLNSTSVGSFLAKLPEQPVKRSALAWKQHKYLGSSDSQVERNNGAADDPGLCAIAWLLQNN